jgi:extradiol dioxygenase family protein
MGLVYVPHFGVHLNAEEFKDLKERVIQNNIKFINEPYIRFKGKVLEQETMFFEDPNGNVLEIKTMINPSALFK